MDKNKQHFDYPQWYVEHLEKTIEQLDDLYSNTALTIPTNYEEMQERLKALIDLLLKDYRMGLQLVSEYNV